ncbi:MAG TPA: lysophospholipid acyltransferase family protein [Candidatus Binatia bacterium]|jgi:KDO2-lipid IV(A) lauroyltransferase|nr:lysophospholipid acyltransferase family protein [Candidatus Binatia bacterium]
MENPENISPLSRWSRRQRLKNAFLYYMMRAGTAAVERLPVRGLLRLLGCLAPYLFRREARRAQAQLSVVLPHLDAAKTTRRMFVHLAESIWELCRLQQSMPALDGAARHVLDEVLAEGKGVVLITGHIGNWEILGQAIAAGGYPITTIARPSYDPRVTAWLHQWRTRGGLQIVWRERNSGKAILRALRKNGLMAFLIDQDTETSGTYVPFFGRAAFTPTTPAALALRTGAPVIFCWHHRRGKHHEITIERIHYVPTGDSRRDVLALTVILSARLESVIRAVPEQWVWMHKRWRKISQEYVLGATT